MRIAIPISDGSFAPSLGGAVGFRFYEDDHGSITRQFYEPMEAHGTDAAIALLERYSIDALVCPDASEDEKRAVSAAGMILFPTLALTPDAAAAAFLSGSVVSDPNNTCTACRHRAECASGGGSCSLK